MQRKKRRFACYEKLRALAEVLPNSCLETRCAGISGTLIAASLRKKDMSSKDTILTKHKLKSLRYVLFVPKYETVLELVLASFTELDVHVQMQFCGDIPACRHYKFLKF